MLSSSQKVDATTLSGTAANHSLHTSYDDVVPPHRDTDPRPLSALPSPAARIAAFVTIVLGGLAGGLIGYALVNVQCSGSCALPLGLGGFVGAVTAAAGTAIVAVLVLRAMGEWHELQDRT